MKIGSKARLIQPVVEGPITDKRFNKDGDCLEYEMTFQDANGNVHTRWFLETQLEVTAEPAAPTEVAAPAGN